VASLAPLTLIILVSQATIMAKSHKRTRNEREQDSSHDQTAGSPKRHTDLWFSDGSIVLCVEDTLFRVHRTTLCAHSAVFVDVFSLPQPPGENVIDGCPVVHMPDMAKDFEHFLTALYDPL
jgi:hypothetical protein